MPSPSIRLICTSFTTSSPATALRAFAAAVEDRSTVGRVLADVLALDVPDNHDAIFAGPEDGGGIFAEVDAEAERIDGGPYMARLSVTRAEIDAEPGLLGEFYGGSRAGAVRLFCAPSAYGDLLYYVEARSYEGTFGPAAVQAWSEAACRRIGAANAVINAARGPVQVRTWADEEE